jgi:hypothetical protein
MGEVMSDLNKPCPMCGEDQFEWGVLRSTSYRRGLGVVGGGWQVVKARRCLTCHHLTMFTDEAITRRDSAIHLVTTLIKAIPLLVILALVGRGLLILLQVLQSFAQETSKVKTQLDTISDQLNTVSTRFTFGQRPRETKKAA